MDENIPSQEPWQADSPDQSIPPPAAEATTNAAEVATNAAEVATNAAEIATNAAEGATIAAEATITATEATPVIETEVTKAAIVTTASTASTIATSTTTTTTIAAITDSVQGLSSENEQQGSIPQKRPVPKDDEADFSGEDESPATAESNQDMKNGNAHDRSDSSPSPKKRRISVRVKSHQRVDYQGYFPV
jgi:hypothetical protein